MFAIIKNNAIDRFLPEGVAFKIDSTVYPQDWLNLSTPAQKAALGIVDVVYGVRPDDKYYWVTEQPPVYANGVVTIDYTATPKDLAGCIKQAVSAINAQAYSILLPTDYIDVRNLRDPNYKIDWMIWRESILNDCHAQVSKISACTTVDELAALPSVQWSHDPDYVEPITEAVE